MTILYIFVFILCCGLLFWAGRWLIKALAEMARFLKWREFVVVFFAMAFVGAVPNFLIGISSAIHGIPQLSFGDVVGGNVVDLTIAVALAAFIAKGLPAKSKTVQTTSVFTIIIALMPLVLLLDGGLTKGDGILLILAFLLYVYWLFSKKERFTKIYGAPPSLKEVKQVALIKRFKKFIKDLGRVILGIGIMLLAAEGVVRTASFLAQGLNIPLVLVGILIVGLGNALPETCFGIASAQKGRTWMILGDLMGSVIASSTLVLGTVAIINPIEIGGVLPYFIARISLVISALLFLIFIRTDQKITPKESKILLGLYFLFVIFEIISGLI